MYREYRYDVKSYREPLDQSEKLVLNEMVGVYRHYANQLDDVSTRVMFMQYLVKAQVELGDKTQKTLLEFNDKLLGAHQIKKELIGKVIRDAHDERNHFPDDLINEITQTALKTWHIPILNPQEFIQDAIQQYETLQATNDLDLYEELHFKRTMDLDVMENSGRNKTFDLDL